MSRIHSHGLQMFCSWCQTRENAWSLLPGLKRKWTGRLLSGPKSSLQVKGFISKIRVPESGGPSSVTISPEWGFHCQRLFGASDMNFTFWIDWQKVWNFFSVFIPVYVRLYILLVGWLHKPSPPQPAKLTRPSMVNLKLVWQIRGLIISTRSASWRWPTGTLIQCFVKGVLWDQPENLRLNGCRCI